MNNVVVAVQEGVLNTGTLEILARVGVQYIVLQLKSDKSHTLDGNSINDLSTSDSHGSSSTNSAAWECERCSIEDMITACDELGIVMIVVAVVE